MLIGKSVLQPHGYKAFIPEKFPPQELIPMDAELVKLLSDADLSLGKLDGSTQWLPDIDFFIFMYVRKEAALSSQIEGTGATLVDAIKADAQFTKKLPKDVDDILHYIKAMNTGLQRLETIPLSLRLICEVHKELLTGARSDHFPAPGEFRTTQNWIGGNSPATAKFVPPPIHEMKMSLGDLENFLHSDDDLPSLVKTALMHAQFETIHPFLDGNGRTGRLLITFYLCQKGILERPVLYLSEYFKRNRDIYFELLHSYHQEGDISRWVKFFLQGVNEVARDAADTSRKITELHKKNMIKIQSLGRSSEKAMNILMELYKLPIVNVKKVGEWVKASRMTANTLVNKLVDVGVLHQQDESKEYGRVFEYREFLRIFIS